MKASVKLTAFPFVMSCLIAGISACNNGSGGHQYPSYFKMTAMYQGCMDTYSSDGYGFGFLADIFYASETDAARSPLDTGARVGMAASNCVRKAGNCDQFNACAYASAQQISVACATGADGCAAGSAVACKFGNLLEPCSAAGLVCVGNPASQSGSCATGTCDTTKYIARCDGNYLYSCVNGGEKISDCTSISKLSVCKDDIAYPACVLPSQPRVYSCDGNTLVLKMDTVEVRYDCKHGDPDAVCKKTETGAVCGLATPECDANLYVETCSNGVIGFCIGGRLYDYDCKSAGLSGCKKTAESSKKAFCVK